MSVERVHKLMGRSGVDGQRLIGMHIRAPIGFLTQCAGGPEARGVEDDGEQERDRQEADTPAPTEEARVPIEA